MHRNVRFAALAALSFAMACEAQPGPLPAADEEVGGATQAFTATELFDELKEIEGLLPAPSPTEVIEVGTFDAATGEFTGLTTIPGYYDYEIGRYIPPISMSKNIHAVRAIMRFRVVNQGSSTVRVTTNGRLTFRSGGPSYVDVNVGLDEHVDWRIEVGSRYYSDELGIRRSGVDGLGAFEIAAMPTGLLYEPPQGMYGGNTATFSRIEQRTAVTEITNESSTSTKRPKFVPVDGLRNAITGLVGKFEDTIIKSKLNLVGGLVGSVSTEVVEGTVTGSGNRLEFVESNKLTLGTHSEMGPGQGDLVTYLRNARFAWSMRDGRVELTLIDFEETAHVPVSQLQADLDSVRAGGPASFTGLEQHALEGLLALDPFVPEVDVLMDSSRFVEEPTILVGGATVDVSRSHAVTSTDRSYSESFTTRIRRVEGHTIPVLGIGTSPGTHTTTMRMKSSQSVSTGEAITSTFHLEAAPTESYRVEVYFDRFFNTFALRFPPECPPFDPANPDAAHCTVDCPCAAGEGGCTSGSQCEDGLLCVPGAGASAGLPGGYGVCLAECPAFDPSRPNASFCSSTCPCDDGEGDCDRDSDCVAGTTCLSDRGPSVGLPTTYDVCMAECPPFDPSKPNASFCTAQCPCSSGEGDCDNDSQCAGWLVCRHDVGARYGFPASWDFCESPFVIATPTRVGSFSR